MRCEPAGPDDPAPPITTMVTWTEDNPPHMGAAADQAFFLCTTPRSGSTLLCGLLADAGAGWPASYYHRPTGMATRARELGVVQSPGTPGFDGAYLHAIRKAGSAGTGMFGMRLMWDYAPGLFAVLDGQCPGLPDDLSRIQAAFGPTRFIHLTRQDKVAQAVSLHKAEATGLWHRAQDGSVIEGKAPVRGPGYDADALAGHLRDVSRADRSWAAWFAEQGIAPHRIAYEALAEDPIGVLARALQAIGLDPARSAGVTPATARLSDPESAAWAARFRSEHPEFNAL